MIWIIAALIVACFGLLGFWFGVFQELREVMREEAKSARGSLRRDDHGEEK